MKRIFFVFCAFLSLNLCLFAGDVSNEELLRQLQALQQQMTLMQQQYDEKIQSLNEKIVSLERQEASFGREDGAAAEAVEEVAGAVSSEAESVVAADDFSDEDLYSRLNNRLENLVPLLNAQGGQLGISAIIETNFHHDTVDGGIGELKEEIAGFGHHHEEEEEGHYHHHGDKNGFNLHHVELGLSAEVDPYFRSWATLAFEDGESPEVEEAVIQTTGLPGGLTLSAGKLMSGIGRINHQHSHVWDFMDTPLVYEKFLGDHGLQEKGLQLTWKAPTPFYLLLGTEVGNGENENFSHQIGGDFLPDHDAPRLFTGFVKFAPELGERHALQIGLSYVRARHQMEHEHGEEVEALDGYNTLYGADFVYKYAGYGAKGQGDFVLQGEYFFRDSDMRNHQEHCSFNNRQDGYYLQALYGFAPRWRAGVRWEQLGLTNRVENDEEGRFTAGGSNRTSAMLDWKLSEFSLLRLQCARHNYATDDGRKHAWEFGLQFQISLGSHPAHDF